MYNNYINKYDVIDLPKKAGKAIRKLFHFLLFNKKKRVENVFSVEKCHPANWCDIPEVQTRWNKMISGQNQIDHYEYLSKKYLSGKTNLRALSLGCGTGFRELRWKEAADFQLIDAIDLSEHSIAFAKKEAIKKGVENIIFYRVDDISTMNATPGYYDLIIVENALHHFSPLKQVMEKINSFLKDDGYFIMNEFIGPTRFQWTERQVNAINGLLTVLPRKYKKYLKENNYKSCVFKHSIFRMMLGDPSEAIESAKIHPLLFNMFAVLEYKEYGGAILHPLLSDIAHNFTNNDPVAKRWLELLFEAEDLLMREKEIGSDFALAICRKRSFS
jgi:SAM-dependent methyltransferase